MKKVILSSCLLSSMCLSASAITWDSTDYSNQKAIDFAKPKSHKITTGGCSGSKAKNLWITSAKHCGSRNQVKQGGKTFKVLETKTDSGSDCLLYKVDKKLPSGRVMPTSSDVSVNTQFYKLGQGWYGLKGSLTKKGGTYRGGRNEVDKLNTSKKAFNFWWNSSYEDEVGTANGDSGGPAVAGGKQVGTVWGANQGGLTGFVDADWTRTEGFWDAHL